MAAVDYFKLVAFIHLGADIARRQRTVGERQRHIELPDGERACLHRIGALGDLLENIAEKTLFYGDRLVLGAHDFTLVLLKLAGDEALSGRKRLAALVIAGNHRKRTFGDLDDEPER